MTAQDLPPSNRDAFKHLGLKTPTELTVWGKHAGSIVESELLIQPEATHTHLFCRGQDMSCLFCGVCRGQDP